MAEKKKLYFIKLQPDFFSSKEVLKLRKIPGGDTYTIIYLKMLLLSLETDGYLYYEGIDESFAHEIALQLYESPEAVQMTLNYLANTNLIIIPDEEDVNTFLLPFISKVVGSESKSAERVRRYRERKKEQEGFIAQLDKAKLTGNIDSEKVAETDASGYGTLNNVILSDSEYVSLRNTYVDYNKLINKVSVYLPNAKKTYPSHFALCLKIAEEDGFARKVSEVREEVAEARKRKEEREAQFLDKESHQEEATQYAESMLSKMMSVTGKTREEAEKDYVADLIKSIKAKCV